MYLKGVGAFTLRFLQTSSDKFGPAVTAVQPKRLQHCRPARGKPAGAQGAQSPAQKSVWNPILEDDAD